jgi:hypothetical protein
MRTMERVAPPPQPPPDDFDLAYFVHCLAFVEQEKQLAKRRVDRALRVGATAIMCVAIAFLAGCTVPHIPQRPDRVQYALSVLPVPPMVMDSPVMRGME